METMRYRETKKSSKAVVFFILLFLVLGGAVIYYAINSETEPVVIGQVKTEVQSLKEVDSISVNTGELENLKYEVKDKKITDLANQKFKGTLVLPVITIDGEKLEELNNTIEKSYVEMFNSLKNTSGAMDNNYSYEVSYKAYDSIIDNIKVLSVTIHDKTIDVQSKKSIRDRITTYNIDMTTKNTLKQSDLIVDILGSECKSKIKDKVKDYFVSNKYIKSENYTYTYTGLENFYVKDNKFHIVFNEGDVVDKKYGIMDITIE
ncbi:hypothetical protein D3C73_996230 [compost metagenome]